MSTPPYPAPSPQVGPLADVINNSGAGPGSIPPYEVYGWNWGAFVLAPLWGICNGTWRALFTVVPVIGWVYAYYLGSEGRKLAWQNKRWKSLKHFTMIQSCWSWAGLLVGSVMLLYFMLIVFLIFFGVH